MKSLAQTLALLILALGAKPLYAQETIYRATYDMIGSYDAGEGSKPKANRPYPVALEIYPDKAFFYNIGQMTCDSVIYATYQETADEQLAINKSNEVRSGGMPIHILSDFVRQQHSVSHVLNFDSYLYTEPMTRPEWVIHEDSTAVHSGYTCHLATAHYYGRDWKVWYTPEIPTSAGPWKLWGLPGLIVSASESEGLYAFTLTSLVQIPSKDSKIDYEKYIVLGEVKKQTKSKVMQLVQVYTTDMMQFYQLIYPGMKVTIQDDKGNALSPEDLRSKFVDIEK